MNNTNVPFISLESLEKKIIPNKQKEIRINFGESEQDTETEEEQPKPMQKKMSILDKRRSSNIDRKQILERLEKNNALIVKSELLIKKPIEIPESIPAPAIILPTSIKRKLVLKETGSKPSVPEKQEQLQQNEQEEKEKEKIELEIESENEAEIDIEKELNEITQLVELKEPAVLEEDIVEKIIEKGPGEKPKRGKKPKQANLPEIIPEIDLTTAVIRSQNVVDRLPKEREKVIIKAPSYYMNNRKIFIQKLTELFKPYREDILRDTETASCDAGQSSDFDLLTHQKIVRDYLNLYTPYRGLLLYHGLGAGKCHAKDTPIMIYDGSIKMVQDIEVGDLLMGDDSTPRKVLSLARGKDRMYDIIPIKGDKYTVNQEHILCLRASGFPKINFNKHNKNHNFNIQWIENNEFKSKTFSYNNDNIKEVEKQAYEFFETVEETDNIIEITVNDYLNLSKKKKGFLKGYRVPVEFPEKELLIDPYMIGYWLGDGTSSRCDITSQDSVVLHYFANNLQKYNLHLSYNSGYSYCISGNGKKNNNIFLNTLKKLDMINNKHIPMLYKCNSRENRLKLLAGLLDSDGNYYRDGFEFSQKNEKLINDVIFLARSLGFSCYKKIKNTSWVYKGEKKRSFTFRITINGKGIEEIPTKIPRKRANPRNQTKDVLVTGINVEYVKEDDYYGFTLDGNCRYLIGDFTVTHNTCTSIAIAEGMKSNKRVFVMTPASLKMNFFSEMKKCGDNLYKKNQFWEFVSIDGSPEYVGVLSRALSLSVDFIRKKGGAWLVNIQKEPNFTELSTDEQTNIDEQLNEMIRSKYTDINYNGLNRNKLNLLTGNLTRNPFDNSVVIIDEAHNFVSRIVNKIKSKDSISFILYDYLMKAENAKIVLLTGTPIINYPNEIGILFNILRGYIKSWTMTLNVKTSEKINTDSIITILDKANLKTFDLVEYSGNKLTITRNPFGFINTKKRGVAKGTRREKLGGGMNKTKKNNSVNSKNTKNSDIETNQFAERIENPGNNEYIEEDADVNKLYRKGMNLDNNPYQNIGEGLFKGGASEAFEKYEGVKLDESGNISDTDFINKVVSILRKNDIEIPPGSIEMHLYKALPDDSEKFLNTFVNIENGDANNLNLFQRRILGLTSYFRSAQEQLLPRFVKTPEGDNYHVVKSVMSNYQFGLYEKIRKEEADRERNAKKQRRKQQNEENVYNISSTYRIFSRAACNFVFPESIERPVPIVKEDKEVSEATFDAIPIENREIVDEYAPIGEEEDEKEAEEEITNTNITSYAKRIEKAMEDINVKTEGTNESKYLSFESLETLSPKFAQIVKNISDPENVGLHLLYSHFRTIEGIGILKLILKANGFVEFKIKRNTSNDWEIDDEFPEENAGKPRFALYTGTETVEEKEIIRNVFNGMWDYIPASISKALRENSENNMYGEAIKLLMITSSGAEGINLRNTRFVHITEPYWHMPRVEQVIGRARRICSHQDLPEELRTVKVFLYITTLSEEQKTDEKNIELRIRDLSRIDKKTPVTTDETLYEIASLKQRINNQILQAVKESAVDCNLYSVSKNKEENLVCYGFGKVESNQFISYPSFDRDREEKTGLDVETVRWKAIKVTIAGIEYALNEDTMELYDFESYQRSAQSGVAPILIGRLINKKGRYEIIRV